MNRALLWLWWNNLRGAVVRRVRRLREPRYLIGGLFALLYFGFLGFQFFFKRGGRTVPSPAGAEEMIFAWSAGLTFLTILSAWVTPGKRAALAFPEHELAWLFPAPLSRVQLINWRLFSVQAGVLFVTLLISIAAGRSTPIAWWQDWISVWILWTTFTLHCMLGACAAEWLALHGISESIRRLSILVLVLVAGWVLMKQAEQRLPEGIPDREQWLAAAKDTPLLRTITIPLRQMIEPFYARSTSAWATAAALPLGLLVVHWLLVLRLHRPFEEASMDAATRRAERIAAWQGGRFFSRKQVNESAPLFPLRPEGTPWIALTWKQLAGNVSRSSLAAVFLVAGVLIAATLWAHTRFDPKVVGGAAGLFAYIFMIFTVFAAPWRAAMGLCGELGNSDQMRAWPLKPWQVVLGQLLGPLVRMVISGWLLLGLGAAASLPLCNMPKVKLTGDMLVSLTICAGLLLPGAMVLLTAVPSALVLSFPGWFVPGTKKMQQGPEHAVAGFFAMILLMAVFLIGFLPVAIFAAALYWLAEVNLWTPWGVILIGAGGLVLLAGEAVLIARFLGSLFARYDFSEASLGSRKKKRKQKVADP